MAFPSVRSSANGRNGTNTTTFTPACPATVVAGDILFIALANDGAAATLTWDNSSAGTWTLLETLTNSGHRLTVYWKVADGTEDGVALSVGVSSSEQCTWYSAAVQDTSGLTAAAFATGSSTGPDAPSFSPAGGSQDYLWFAVTGFDNQTTDTTVSSYPASFTGNNHTDATTGTGNAKISVASRQNATATENPGAWTISLSQNWVAGTLAFAPVAGSSLTDVDTDETIYTGQSGIAYTGTGLTNADGLVVTTDTTSNAAATAFSATNATSGTFTAPTLAACFTAGTKFGSCAFDVQDGGVSLGTLSGTFNAEPAYTVHTVSDISQAADHGCIYYWINQAGTDVAVGDQVIFDNQGGNVTMDSQGFLAFANGETFTTYRARDDTDNTWSSAWATFSVLSSAASGIGDLASPLSSNLVSDLVH